MEILTATWKSLPLPTQVEHAGVVYQVVPPPSDLSVFKKVNREDLIATKNTVYVKIAQNEVVPLVAIPDLKICRTINHLRW